MRREIADFGSSSNFEVMLIGPTYHPSFFCVFNLRFQDKQAQCFCRQFPRQRTLILALGNGGERALPVSCTELYNLITLLPTLSRSALLVGRGKEVSQKILPM